MQVPAAVPRGALALCLAAAAGVLTLPAPAAGELSSAAVEDPAGDYETASLRLVESAPDRPSGYEVRIDYTNPDDPEAKPPSVRRVVQIFPQGTRIDTAAPARCSATDQELMLLGPEACPQASVVGTGFIRLDTGLPEPGRYLREDVVFLNNTRQIIYLTTDRATGARVVVRAEVRRNRVVTEAPLLPGAGTDGTAIDVARGDFPRLVRSRDGHRRAYVATPERCPSQGYWVTRIRFEYHDGTTATERTRNRCAA